MVEQFKELKVKVKALLVEIEDGIDEFNKDQDFDKRAALIPRLNKKLNEADQQMKDIELEVGVLKEMGQEKLIVKKYNKLQNRYKETRKNFLQQKDNFETQKNRREALKRPRSKGVNLWQSVGPNRTRHSRQANRQPCEPR
eukprot:TRINITY_DN9523_c0_g1_i10.p1 TRINITY_DN9523_c0_g1~~TRINITY_DN9523_c0_g1_i10.p1  ORF type:complete len:141 (-),score=46.15 TRINITY_DN9523_c0_g1_i10:486-908(-)